MVSSLMNALEGECLSRNLCKCKQVARSVIVLACLFVYPLFYTALCCCLFTSFFILLLLVYFCLFVDHVNRPTIFVFDAFVYHFKNTISIFVTLCSVKLLDSSVSLVQQLYRNYSSTMFDE